MDKDEQINVRNIDPELKRRAQIQAIQQGRSLSEVIRELLQEWTQEPQQKQQQKSKK
jgi:plasmid stability protein